MKELLKLFLFILVCIVLELPLIVFTGICFIALMASLFTLKIIYFLVLAPLVALGFSLALTLGDKLFDSFSDFFV